MKLSNKFTLARAVFAPIFFLLYTIPLWLPSAHILSTLSAIILIPLLAVFELTDYFDGHYARKNNEVSDFGKLFDPFADVMLNLTIFLCAVQSGYMPIFLFILILYREFSQNFLRMVAVGKGVAIAARKGGKIKTVFYIIAGFTFLATECAVRLGIFTLIGPLGDTILRAARIAIVAMFVICVVLSYASFIDYIRTFKSVISEKK